ncbi:MAG: ATP-binding cassette domain-containing protein, partial [Chloroflexota bacterium]
VTAEANLDFFGQLYGLDATTRRERSQRLLRVFGLWERRDEAAATFSKGMKQKLAIARALLPEPKVLFLDEPTAALDPEAAFVVREAIASLRSAGRTIVLATHNLDEAQRLCDRIAFVRGGFLRVDTPARLRGSASGPAVDIVLDGDGDGAALVAAARAVPGVTTADARDGELRVGLADPARVTPELVRSLVAAGAAILEVRPRTASLEDVYFEVMGVHPGSDGALS